MLTDARYAMSQLERAVAYDAAGRREAARDALSRCRDALERILEAAQAQDDAEAALATVEEDFEDTPTQVVDGY